MRTNPPVPQSSSMWNPSPGLPVSLSGVGHHFVGWTPKISPVLAAVSLEGVEEVVEAFSLLLLLQPRVRQRRPPEEEESLLRWWTGGDVCVSAMTTVAAEKKKFETAAAAAVAAVEPEEKESGRRLKQRLP